MRSPRSRATGSTARLKRIGPDAKRAVGPCGAYYGPRQPGEVAVPAAVQLPMMTGCAPAGEMLAFPVTWAFGMPAKRQLTAPPPLMLSVPPCERLKNPFDSCWNTIVELTAPP